MKSRTPVPVSSFADALYEVVHRSPVPAKAIAEELDISYQLLANAANPNMDRPRIHADRIVALTRASRNFALLDYMEQATGRVAIRLPSGDCLPRDVMRAAMDAISRFGLLAEEINQAMGDERISDGEANEIETAGFAAAKAIMAAIHAARLAAERGGR